MRRQYASGGAQLGGRLLLAPSPVIALVIALAIALAPKASAHGGRYLGVPSPSLSPAPVRGPSTGLAPNLPVPSSTNGLANTASSTTSGLPSSTTSGEVDWLAWSWWWEFNKEPYLALVDRSAPEPGETTSHLRVTVEQVTQEIVPALREALRSSTSNDVITGSLIALARLGDDLDARSRTTLAAEFRPFLRDPNQEIVETATIALGVLQDESSAFLLSDLLLDTTAGRSTVRATEVNVRTRAFAAYALGLIGHGSHREDVQRFVVHTLIRALANDKTASPDVGTACVMALGRVPLGWSGVLPEPTHRSNASPIPASVSREAQVLALLKTLTDRHTRRVVRAHVPAALARLVSVDHASNVAMVGDASTTNLSTAEQLRQRVGTALLATLRRSGTAIETEAACVMAFGLIGDADDDKIDRDIRSALRAADSDRTLRNFAVMSLARIAARAGPGAPSQDDDIRSELLRGLARQRNDRARWSALGLAVLEHNLEAAPDVDIARALSDKLKSSRAPSDIGAFAIAAGLHGHPDASEPLRVHLRPTSQESARGHAAVGLALVGLPQNSVNTGSSGSSGSSGSGGAGGAGETLEQLRAMVESATYRPELLSNGALALSILGDQSIVRLLTDKLESTNSLAALAGLARAVGRVGDNSSVEPVLSLLRDDKKPSTARAFAAVALGLMADRDAQTWTAIYSVDTNYLALPATLYDSRGLGILNIL